MSDEMMMETTLEAPEKPDTASSIAKGVKENLFLIRESNRMLRRFLNNRNDDGSKWSIEQLREHCRKKGANFLDCAILHLEGEYSAEECWRAFSHPTASDFDDNEWIRNFVSATREEPLKNEDKCVFVGIIRALGDEVKGGGKTSGKSYDEDEDEDHWSWRSGRRAPDADDLYYGVRLGAIAEHAEDYAREILPLAPRGSTYSSPWAKFVQDADEATPSKAPADGATPEDIRVCRAKRSKVKNDAFCGRDAAWTCDGGFGFTHIGCGYRGGVFLGELFKFRGHRLVSKSIKDEFWAAPQNQWFFADRTTDTAWVHADQRVKGFTINSDDELVTSYIFNVAKTHDRALSNDKRIHYHGCVNLMLLGSNLAYMKGGMLQEWALNEANRHDGIRRMCSTVYGAKNEWKEDEILDLTDEGECSYAESSVGVKPDSIRSVDIFTPSSVGYLADHKVSFAHEGSSEIKIYDHALREISRLVGFDRDGVEIVQRPTFEHAGDKNMFVANDPRHVKIFDLRTSSCSIAINQKCEYSTPVYCGDGKFICNKLSNGKEAMIWDIRTQKPLYSLPARSGDIEWVPTSEHDQGEFPMLIISSGLMYQYGLDP